MISLDRRYQQGASLLDICAKSFLNHPHRTLLPRRILLAESDCERLAARGHCLERYGYEVLSCCGSQSVEKCLVWMSSPVDCNVLVDLIMCDVHLLNESIVRLIQNGQKQSHFPPLLLIVGRSDSPHTKGVNQLKSKGCLKRDEDPQGQMLLVRQWAPY